MTDQAFMAVLVTCKFKNGHNRFFHCKSMQIFPDAQGQLTPQSEVGSA